MERPRRSFAEEYKRQAAELVVSSGCPMGSVAKELALPDSLLRRWLDRLRQQPASAAWRPHHAGDADVGGPGFGDRPVGARRTNGCAWSATF